MVAKRKNTNKLTKMDTPKKTSTKKVVQEEQPVEEEKVVRRKNLNESVQYKKKELPISNKHKIIYNESNYSNSILCISCDSVVDVDQKCKCKTDPVKMKIVDHILSIQCKDMTKIYHFNNVDKIWFKSDLKL